MAITFHNNNSLYRLEGKRAVASWLKGVILAEGLETGAVAVVFCGPEEHIEINRKYLCHDYHTDVITFDYSDPEAGTVSGDIMISPATVADNAAGMGVDVRAEMLRVILHGVLHLCGHGDQTPKEQAAMRALEDLYLGMSGLL